MVEMEFDSTRQYLETELRRAQEELEKFTEKLRRCVLRLSTSITLAVCASTHTNANLTCGDHVAGWNNFVWSAYDAVRASYKGCVAMVTQVTHPEGG